MIRAGLSLLLAGQVLLVLFAGPSSVTVSLRGCVCAGTTTQRWRLKAMTQSLVIAELTLVERSVSADTFRRSIARDDVLGLA